MWPAAPPTPTAIHILLLLLLNTTLTVQTATTPRSRQSHQQTRQERSQHHHLQQHVAAPGQLFTDKQLHLLAKKAEYELKVYVYDLYDEFASWGEDIGFINHLDKQACYQHPTPRLEALMELLVPRFFQGHSVIRVWNGSLADLFLVEHDLMCRLRANEARPVMQTFLVAVMNNVITNYPWYNASQGRDHILTWAADGGPFCDSPVPMPPQLLRLVHNMIVITHGGSVGLVNNATGRPCFRPGHDLVIPRYRPPSIHAAMLEFLDPEQIQQLQYDQRLLAERPHHLLVPSGGGSAPDEACSASSALLHLAAAGSGSAVEVSTSGRLNDSYFSLCWSGPGCAAGCLLDAFANLTIPVLAADHAVLPFERFLAWQQLVSKPSPAELFTGPVPVLSQAAAGFEEALDSGDRSRINATLVHRKRAAIQHMRDWLGWEFEWGDWNTTRTAWKLVIVELWCRTDKGRAFQRVCARPSAGIASQSFL